MKWMIVRVLYKMSLISVSLDKGSPNNFHCFPSLGMLLQFGLAVYFKITFPVLMFSTLFLFSH